MDIVLKLKPLKASYDTISTRSKIIIVITLISLISIVIPHQTEVQAKVAQTGPLTFNIGDYEDHFNILTAKAKKNYTHEEVVRQLRRQMGLEEKVRQYLIDHNSPLSQYTNILIQQSNWKKIVALSNAESTMCRRYRTDSANCWGVGGTDLWDMGNNLGEGVVQMNRFLNNYPLRLKTKYAAMSFENMNGLYKQPARDHWLNNNQVVYQELTELENSF